MKLVLFSGGVESTALLVDTINKYDVHNVIALTTIIQDSSDNFYRPLYEATEFYTPKICKILGVTQILSHKSKVGPGQVPNFSTLQFIADAYNFVLANNKITHVFGGVNSSDLGATPEEEKKVPHLALARKLFESVMETYNLDVKYEYPLSHLSKLEQYKLIPDNLRPYIWTCYRYSKRTLDGFTPCDTCFKCLELKNQVFDKYYE